MKSQRLPLDRAGGWTYVVLVASAIATGGCVGSIHSIAPENLHAVAQERVAAWESGFHPTVPLRFDLRWRLENAKGRAAGRAIARFAPPDTLRFDYRGPFGRAGSALIVGERAVWAEPEGGVDDLIPVAPVFWAALGIAMPPKSTDTLLGDATPERTAWRYRQGSEVLDFVHERIPTVRLLAERRSDGKILGVASVQLADTSGTPRAAVMRFPHDRATFALTIRQVDTVAAFPPETWKRS